MGRLISKTFPKYALLVVAASVSATISSFVDGCITGELLGAESMAAFGVALPFVLILVVVPGMIISSGGSIVASTDIGKGETLKAQSSFSSACLCGLGIGLIATIVCLLLAGPIVSITGVTGFIKSEAINYMRGFGVGAIPTIMLTILMTYANVDGNERYAFVAVILMTITDIVLDVLLGVKLHMGLFGMALASSISYLVATIYFFLLFLSGKSIFKISKNASFQKLKEILRFGYPSALNTVLISVRCFALNKILISFEGSDAVSAYSFQSNFNSFFVAIASGIGAALSVLVGIFVGEIDRKKVILSAKAGLFFGLISSLALCVVLFFGAPVFSEWFMEGDSETLMHCSDALRLYSISMPFSVVSIVLIYYYQTIGDRKLANIIAIGHGLVLPLASAYLLSITVGLNGVWISLAVAELLLILSLLIYSVLRNKSVKNHKPQLFMLDEEYCKDIQLQYIYEGAYSAENMTRVAGQFPVFKPAVDYVASMLDPNDSKIILDAQGYDLEGKAYLNVRLSGKHEHELDTFPCVKLTHHYSAGITFINLEQE